MRGTRNLNVLCICNNRQQQQKRYTSNTHTLNKFSTISHLLLTLNNSIRLLYLLLKSWIAIVMAIENCWRADGSNDLCCYHLQE